MLPMRFYVASKFENYVAVREVVKELRERGHEITFDWTDTDEFGADGVLRVTPEKDLTDEQKQLFALKDFWGAYDCTDLLLLCCPNMCGAYVEVGIALAANSRVHIVGMERWTIFWAHPQVQMYDTIDEFWAWLDARRS